MNDKYINEAHNVATNPHIDITFAAKDSVKYHSSIERYSGNYLNIEVLFYADGSVLVIEGGRVKYYTGMEK